MASRKAVFEIIATDENTMISPYSIATALSMLYPGARGTTAEEIAEVLNITVDDETLHAVRNSGSPPFLKATTTLRADKGSGDPYLLVQRT